MKAVSCVTFVESFTGLYSPVVRYRAPTRFGANRGGGRGCGSCEPNVALEEFDCEVEDIVCEPIVASPESDPELECELDDTEYAARDACRANSSWGDARSYSGIRELHDVCKSLAARPADDWKTEVARPKTLSRENIDPMEDVLSDLWKARVNGPALFGVGGSVLCSGEPERLLPSNSSCTGWVSHQEYPV